MKKRFAKISTLMIIFAVMLSQLSAASLIGNYSLGVVSANTSEQLATIENPGFTYNNGIVRVEPEVFANNPSGDSAVIVTAFYDKNTGRLAEYVSVKEFSCGENKVFSGNDAITFETNIAKDNLEVKYFVWDSLLTMGALCDTVTFNNSNLAVKKFSGIITQNRVTSLNFAQDIDTESEVEIEVIFDGYDYENNVAIENSDYANYNCDEIDIIYEGDSNAGDLLGYHVEMQVRETGRTGKYEVISVAKTDKNKVVEFTLDQYDSADAEYINYYKSESDRRATQEKLEDDAVVIYNNIAYNFGTGEDLGDILDNRQTWSGKITLVDNDIIKGADVVFVEIGAVAVVDEVSANGKVSFKNDVQNSEAYPLRNLYFDEEDTATLIELTKGGESIEYTELREWDILSIIFTDNNEGYIAAEVVESSRIEGTITLEIASDTSATGYRYTINGTAYDVAEGWYYNGTIAAGTSGVFYIDNYGKIAAYQKIASDKYGYVLKAVNSQEEMTIEVTLLDKSGEVHETKLADTVRFTGAEKTDAWYKETGSVEIEKIEDSLDDLAEALQGQLVTYDANSTGEIDEIGFALVGDYEGEGEFFRAAYGEASYDEKDRELRTSGAVFDLADDTIVFYIVGEGTIGLGDEADETLSKVGTVASIATNNNVTAAVYDVDNDIPAVVVFYNTTGGISSAENAAVIDEVGTAYVDGEYVIYVTYFYNGEKLSATTDPELSELGDAKLADANPGDIWKFSVVDGVITEAAEFVDFRGRTGDFDSAISSLAFDAGSYVAGNTVVDGDVSSVVFGPAVTYKKTTKKIGLMIEENIKEIKAGNANVYVYDDALKNNKISVGVVSDINVDEDLLDPNGGITIKNGDKVDVAADVLPTGMFDYVAAVYNEDEVIDLVIYKAYEFKYVIKDSEPTVEQYPADDDATVQS